jgi:hypothetical protein
MNDNADLASQPTRGQGEPHLSPLVHSPSWLRPFSVHNWPMKCSIQSPWFDIRTSYLQWLEATWIKFRVLPMILVLVHTWAAVCGGGTLLQIQAGFRSLYTRSQGQGWTQIKQSYWCNYWNRPQGLYTMSQGWKRKQVLIYHLMGLTWLQGRKGIPINLGGQFVTLEANVAAI